MREENGYRVVRVPDDLDRYDVEMAGEEFAEARFVVFDHMLRLADRSEAIVRHKDESVAAWLQYARNLFRETVTPDDVL